MFNRYITSKKCTNQLNNMNLIKKSINEKPIGKEIRTSFIIEYWLITIQTKKTKNENIQLPSWFTRKKTQYSQLQDQRKTQL